LRAERAFRGTSISDFFNNIRNYRSVKRRCGVPA
jgi:hypothetical protein